MNLKYLFSAILNWTFGLVGMLALIVVLAFSPVLLGFEDPGLVFMTLGGITFYKGILSFFSNPVAVTILIGSTVLFVWVGLLFSMSFHSMVESFGRLLNEESEGGYMASWVTVLIANFFMVAMFVYVLFGMILTPATLLIGGLMIAAMCALLIANYGEVSRV